MRKYFSALRGASHYFQLLLLFIGLAALLWAFVFFDLHRTHDDLLAKSQSELHNLNLAFAKETESSVKTIDLSLLDLREHWHGKVGDFSLVVRHRQAYLEKDLAFQVSIVDANGFLVFSSLDQQAKSVDLSDREHFRIHRARGSDELFISKPLLGRVSKRWSIQFTRPIYDKQEQFAGVIVLSVSPEYFYRFYRSINLPPDGVISLLREDGEVLSRFPSPEQALGKAILDAPFLDQFSPMVGRFKKVAQIDGIERLYSWRKLEQYHLVVTVGYSMKALMAPYRQQRIRALLAAAGLTLLLALVGYLKLVGAQQRQKAAATLADSEERWRLALEGSGDGVWDWNIPASKVNFSKGWKTMLGYSEADIGSDLDEWKARVHPEDMPIVLQDIQDYFDGKTSGYVNEHRLKCSDGSWKWILDRGMVISRDGEGKPTRMVGTHTDISSRKEMEEALRKLATTDSLTGLNNRRHFLEKLEQELLRLKRNATLNAVVLMADLDHFKRINDSYGHAGGDAALKHFSKLLNDELRLTDAGGRIGGEEFAILLTGTDVEGAQQFAVRLCRKVERTPFTWGDQTISLTVSIGIAAMDPMDSNGEKVLHLADEAMYQAKHNGRNQCVTAA